MKYMGEDAKQLSDKEMIKEIILPNVPPLIKIRIKKFGGETLTWTELKRVLTNEFVELNIENNKKRNQGKSGRNNNRNSRWNNRNNKDGKKDQQENNRNKKKSKAESDSNNSDSDSEREEQGMIARMKLQNTSEKVRRKRSNSCAVLF